MLPEVEESQLSCRNRGNREESEMNKYARVATVVAVALLVQPGTLLNADAAMVPGDTVAVDFAISGGAAPPEDAKGCGLNYNCIEGNWTIPADTVVRISDGAIVSGVSINFNGFQGHNGDPRCIGWGGLAGDPFYVAEAEDIAWWVNWPTATLTFGGLDDALPYNVRVYALQNSSSGPNTYTVTDGTNTQSTTLNPMSDAWNSATLEDAGLVFNGVSTDGAGQIVVTAELLLNAVTITAVSQAAGGTLIYGR
jgi:hypothetical protein